MADACDADPLVAASVVGIHVEGPHIAREDGPRGAHPLEHVRPPDIAEYRRWQEAARGRIRIITVSPEYPESVDYIRAIVADGVVASIGHTAADGDQIRAAVDAGARWSTHLGNGAHALIPRHPNYIWEQLAEDRLSAGLIFDGHHLPPAVIRTMLRAKGIERTILVTDALALAGLPPGVYASAVGGDVELLPSGRVVLSGTPYLAGSAATLGVCLGNAVRHAGRDARGGSPDGHRQSIAPAWPWRRPWTRDRARRRGREPDRVSSGLRSRAIRRSLPPSSPGSSPGATGAWRTEGQPYLKPVRVTPSMIRRRRTRKAITVGAMATTAPALRTA